VLVRKKSRRVCWDVFLCMIERLLSTKEGRNSGFHEIVWDLYGFLFQTARLFSKKHFVFPKGIDTQVDNVLVVQDRNILFTGLPLVGLFIGQPGAFVTQTSIVGNRKQQSPFYIFVGPIASFQV
jgi:hypothetical protein